VKCRRSLARDRSFSLVSIPGQTREFPASGDCHCPVQRVTLCTQDSEWSRTTSYSTHARLGVVPYIELLYVRETRSGPVHRVTLCTGPGVLPRPTSDSTYGGLGVVPYNTPVSVLRAPRSHRRPPVAVRNTAERLSTTTMPIRHVRITRAMGCPPLRVPRRLVASA